MSDRPRSPWSVLTVALSGLFTVSITITILSVSIPRIATDLHSTNSVITWVITGPTLAFGVIGPTVGKAGDLWGHKRLYLIALVGCALFAAGAAAAPNALTLIVFRILGAGMGAATGPSSMAMINRVFPPHDRVRALGFWSFVGAGAPVIGVVIGGPIVEQFGWRWIFIVQCPLCLIGAVIAWRLLPETDRVPNAQFDVRGAVTLGASMTAILLGINRGGALGWTSPVILGAIGGGLAGLVLFLRIESTAEAPLIPIEYLRQRDFSAPLINQSLLNFAYMGGFIVAPLMLHDGLGYSESHSGWLLVIRPFASTLLYPAAGFIALRLGARLAGFAGGVGMIASMVVLAQVGLHTGQWVIAAGLALSGIGIATAGPAMNATVANTVRPTDFGVAGATVQLMNQVGVVMGIQVMTAIQTSREGPGVSQITTYAPAFYAAAVVAGIGGLAALAVGTQLSASAARPSQTAAVR